MGGMIRWRWALMAALAMTVTLIPRVAPGPVASRWSGVAMAADDQMMSVQVRDAPVRSSPSFLGAVVATLPYGRRVAARVEPNGWARVALPGGGGQGWLHASALTPKTIKMQAGAADVARHATSDEVALAGKGFNRQVENAYQAQNPNLDYGWIDRMAGIAVSPDQMRHFMREGNLRPEGGR